MKKLTPMVGASPRKGIKGSGANTVDPIVPGKASPKRGVYPKDNFPKPTGGNKTGFKPRAGSRSPYGNDMPNRQVNGPAVAEGKGGSQPRGNLGSPFRTKGGGGPGNSTKNPKTN